MNYNEVPIAKRRACSERQNKPYHTAVIADLEAQLQAQLHIAGVERSGSLTEITGSQVVIRAATSRCQQEVSSVEHVERLPFELHIHPLSEFESLAQCHVGTPLTRPLELIAAQ